MIYTLYETKSYSIRFYSNSFAYKGQIPLPKAIINPFIQRIVSEKFNNSLKESWGILLPGYSIDKMEKTDAISGFTSYLGERYELSENAYNILQCYANSKIIYFTAIVYEFNKEVFKGDFQIDEIFYSWAHNIVKGMIEKNSWSLSEAPYYYEILEGEEDVLSLPEDLFPEQVYKQKNIFRLPQTSEVRPRIKFRRIDDDKFETLSGDVFKSVEKLGKGFNGQVRILIHDKTYDALKNTIYLSRTEENGGYLIGNVYKLDNDKENREWCIEITDYIEAEFTYSNSIQLLFTGETWSKVKQRLDSEFPEKKLLCWYHTHLFPASDTFGLSGFDIELHRQFFTKPWQIALLINIDINEERVIRCYQPHPDKILEESPFEIINSQ